MAVSTLKKTDFSHGTWGTITVDANNSWTAPSDGILYINMTVEANATRGYLTLAISQWRNIRMNCFAGGYSQTEYVPICKGDVVSYTNSGYLSSYLVQFRSTQIA